MVTIAEVKYTYRSRNLSQRGVFFSGPTGSRSNCFLKKAIICIVVNKFSKEVSVRLRQKLLRILAAFSLSLFNVVGQKVCGPTLFGSLLTAETCLSTNELNLSNPAFPPNFVHSQRDWALIVRQRGLRIHTCGDHQA